ncbi:Ku protein [Paracoccus mutanolyticus]|uniref:Ku protein n=1 Tax=Paracoccus mutanolyticus TaxID=1499308 RepID=UPI001CB8D986|nr:Ku protein [Paracoccus mutanolyticus]
MATTDLISGAASPARAASVTTSLKNDYVILEPEEVAAAVPDSDKTLEVSAFLRCGEIDQVYFDKPYYLAPAAEEGRQRQRPLLALERIWLLSRQHVMHR